MASAVNPTIREGIDFLEVFGVLRPGEGAALLSLIERGVVTFPGSFSIAGLRARGLLSRSASEASRNFRAASGHDAVVQSAVSAVLSPTTVPASPEKGSR